MHLLHGIENLVFTKDTDSKGISLKFPLDVSGLLDQSVHLRGRRNRPIGLGSGTDVTKNDVAGLMGQNKVFASLAQLIVEMIRDQSEICTILADTVGHDRNDGTDVAYHKTRLDVDALDIAGQGEMAY